MKQSKQKIIHLNKRDIGLILGICTLAAILNVYPYPFVAAGAVVIGILLLRLTEDQNESTESGSMQQAQVEQAVEKRSTEEIITDKLNDGRKDEISMATQSQEQEMIHCHQCDGTGIAKPVGGYNVFCEYCDGTGKISK